MSRALEFCQWKAIEGKLHRIVLSWLLGFIRHRLILQTHFITHWSVTHQILLEFFIVLWKRMQSQHKQILLSLSLYWSQNFPSAISLREQYIIFWLTCYPHTYAYTQIKCPKCLHTGSRRPFLYFKIPQAPLLSYILPCLQCFPGLTSEMQPGCQSCWGTWAKC